MLEIIRRKLPKFLLIMWEFEKILTELNFLYLIECTYMDSGHDYHFLGSTRRDNILLDETYPHQEE